MSVYCLWAKLLKRWGCFGDGKLCILYRASVITIRNLLGIIDKGKQIKEGEWKEGEESSEGVHLLVKAVEKQLFMTSDDWAGFPAGSGGLSREYNSLFLPSGWITQTDTRQKWKCHGGLCRLFLSAFSDVALKRGHTVLLPLKFLGHMASACLYVALAL